MTCILRDKFRSLLCGDDGAALVITLAVFFLLYLLCMGSLAVGTAVKERIQLQNACDAAAYSAAVIQADTLSRIATLNRAMSWTYVQMTRRQMDWVTYKWLREVRAHWLDDRNWAKEWARLNSIDCGCTTFRHHGNDWNCSAITLYGAMNVTWGVSEQSINGHNGNFLSTHVGGDESFYANRTAMTAQIEADWRTVREINLAVDRLKDEYPSELLSAVYDMRDVNGGNPRPEVSFEPEDVDRFSEYIANTDSGEDRFLSFIGLTRKSAFRNSGSHPGGAWFVRSGGRGFRRGYRWDAEKLRAEWTWYSNGWHCKNIEGKDIHVGPVPCLTCRHPSHEKCSCLPGPAFHARIYADNGSSKDRYYETPDQYQAFPLVLTEDYFGKAGTLTVGLARRNRNPLAAIWGDEDTIRWSGVLSAFNPFCQDTVVFSSAKAGYKRLGEEYDDAGNLTREYRIDWDDNQDWNLCQSDWDAVFVPVRMAQTMARDGGWEASKNDFLGVWVEKLIGSSKSMRSGGTKRYNPTRDDPLDYRHSRGWGRRPDYAKGLVVTEWQIEDKNKNPDWDRMTERMFH